VWGIPIKFDYHGYYLYYHCCKERKYCNKVESMTECMLYALSENVKIKIHVNLTYELLIGRMRFAVCSFWVLRCCVRFLIVC
jgi:hypothetical protein